MGRAGREGSQRAEQKGGSEGKEEQEARGEHEAGNRATRQDPQPRSLPAPPLLLPEPAPGSWGPRPARTLQAERSAVWKCCRASLKEMRGTAPDFPGSPAGSPGAASAPPASKSAPELAPARPPPNPPQAFLGYLAGSPPAPPIPPALSVPPRCSLPREAGAGGEKWGGPGGGSLPPAPRTPHRSPPAPGRAQAGSRGFCSSPGFPPREGSR